MNQKRLCWTPEQKKQLRTALLLFAALATALFIFSNSLQKGDASQVRSLSVLDRIRQILTDAGLSGTATMLTDHIIRKLGHFSEFLLEGFWLMLCLESVTHRWLRYLAWPALAGLVIAMCDETIQLFIPGRSGMVSDVWIDFSGVLTGMAVATLLCCILRAISAARHAREQKE